jgi:hypothetical protein
MRLRFPPTIPNQLQNSFPFRRDNRRPDGTWEAPDATDDNIKGTSIHPYDPVWPRWIKRPPLGGEGEFVSNQPFFDIDEVTQKATLYPAGTPLVDRNVDGNPASRQRVRDVPSGNLWRRRLLVGTMNDDSDNAPAHDGIESEGAMSALGLAAPKGSGGLFARGEVKPREGLFAADDLSAKRGGGTQSAVPPMPARNQQQATTLPGFRVQAIPQPSNNGYEFSIRLSRGQPQTNLGGALVGHIRREGGIYDPNGIYYPLEDHKDRFGPTEFNEIVDFVPKGQQEAKTNDRWFFKTLPPGWRPDVTVTATWTYVDKLTKADATDKLGFMENPSFSGTFLSKEGAIDWGSLGFRTSGSTQPMTRKIPSQ